MGRSQVERNRIKGRPGRGGRGRGSGGGRGRGSGSGGSKRRSGPDPRTLGDNAFRYERRTKDGDDGSSGMMLDDYNTGLLLGSDYYGASHYDLHQEEDEYTTIPSSENNQNDWMSVDVQALTACLKQLPLHERLDVPYHVGKHIESRYGADNIGGKKTLAELREESKCIILGNETVDEKQNSSEAKVNSEADDDEDDNQNSSDTKEDKGDDDGDDEDDLDAWLDDMIS